MLDFFSKLGAAILTIPALIVGLFSPTVIQAPPNPINNEAPILSGFTPVQAQKFRLSGSGITASATSVSLQTFKLSDASTTITMADFGDIGYGTLEPGTSKEEQISFTGVTQNGDGTATLTGVTRGLDFRGANCVAVTAFQQAHAGGAIFILSNTSCFYSQFNIAKNTSTITGVWTFASSTTVWPRMAATTSLTGASRLLLATLDYVDNVASSGAADADFSTKGLVQIATTTQVASGTPNGGTGAILVPGNQFFGATSSARTMVPVTNSSGKLQQTFFDLTEGFTFTGTVIFNGSTTFVQINSSSIPFLAYQMVSSTIDSSTTATTLTQITEVSSTIVTGARRVEITLTGSWTTTSATNTLNVDFGIDGVRVTSTTTALGLVGGIPPAANGNSPLSVTYTTKVLSAGSHIFSVWLSSGNAASRAIISGTNWPTVFTTRELY